MDQYLICDTGTLLSLRIVAKDFPVISLNRFRFIISPQVESELKEFSKHKDLLGTSAEEILQENIIIKKAEGIEELKRMLGVSGRQRITDADLSIFLLAKKERRPLFTDDFSVLIHISPFFPEENIFHGLALIARLLAMRLTTDEIYDYIFNKFIPKRWSKITEQRLVDIETIVDEALK